MYDRLRGPRRQELQARAHARHRRGRWSNDTTWEFTLKQGVKFHNGEPFNAQSVKATMDYIMDPANKTHYAAALVAGEGRPDRQRLHRALHHREAVARVSSTAWPPPTSSPCRPRRSRSRASQALAAKPIGTGPFKFVQWVRDEKLVLERNPDYWQGPAEVSRVTFRFIPEFSARLAALLAGEIDIMKDVPPLNVDQRGPERQGQGAQPPESSRINYLALVNLKPGPMQDLKVRRAIHHAVNVDELIAQVLQRPRHQDVRAAVAAQRGLFPQGRVHQVRSGARPGAPQGGGRRIRPSSSSRSTRRPAATRSTRTSRWPSPSQLGAHRDQGQRGGERVGHPPRQDQEPDHRRHVLPRVGTGAGRPRAPSSSSSRPSQTYSSYGNNAAIDAKIAQAVTIVDPKKRLEAWAELQQLVRDEVPWVFLWQQHDLYGVANWIEWTPARRREGLDVRGEGRRPLARGACERQRAPGQCPGARFLFLTMPAAASGGTPRERTVRGLVLIRQLSGGSRHRLLRFVQHFLRVIRQIAQLSNCQVATRYPAAWCPSRRLARRPRSVSRPLPLRCGAVTSAPLRAPPCHPESH